LNYQVAYFLVATSFILILNLMAFISLQINYRSTRKAYLLLACIAIAIEALRQIPALLLSFNPESNPALVLSFFLQFSASWMLLCAIVRKEHEFNTDNKILLGLLLAVYVASAAFHIINGTPQSAVHWVTIVLPAILIVLAILWQVRHTKINALSGRILLVLSAAALVTIRVALLLADSTEMVYLLYYLDVLMFPVLVSALILAEVENAHFQVSTLLDEKSKSEEDLRFILDNSMDIILTVSKAGLLLSWNKRAELVFGYTEAQTVKKTYIDELFSGNYWHKSIDHSEEFDATMERRDGKVFPVKVRIKTVIDNEKTYSIYVIKDGVIEP